MHPNDRRLVQERWDEIIDAIDAAGVPLDRLSLLAIVAGAQVLHDRSARMAERQARPIGFAPSTRKGER